MTKVSLMYASKTNKAHNEVKPDLMDILTQAINFNQAKEITGVLYYGNGYFLQYIEGDKEAIDNLFYNSIVKDTRHSNCEVLYYAEIVAPIFKKWNMKFAPINQNIKQFFQEYHIDDFNPYLLTAETIDPLIKILVETPAYDVTGYQVA